MRASWEERILIPLVLFAACMLLLLQKIDLTNVDLGRHLKNGELILNGSWQVKSAVLHTNFYSYAQGGFPFVNHHWLSGVVLYLVWRFLGFPGTVFVNALLVAASVAILYLAVRRAYGARIAAPLAALAIPLAAWRFDIRPEAFTDLLIALFYALLLGWERGYIPTRRLYWLPVLMLLWVNLHIGFVFGFVVAGFFALKTWGPRARAAWPVGGLMILAAVLNPNLLSGALYPLNIFRNYGYSVAENLSIPEMAQHGLSGAWEYSYFYALAAFAAFAVALRWFRAASGSPSRGWDALLLGSLIVLAYSEVRNLPVFALFFVPVLAPILHDAVGVDKNALESTWLRAAAAVLFAAGILCAVRQLADKHQNFGLGLRPGVESTAEFLRANRIGGPVFNDVDIGGYLIFHDAKVFVDGRPEAYPSEFLRDTFVESLSNPAVWKATDGQYRFNAIVCSLEDAFPPIERFLIDRAHDPEWAPVFSDDYSLVFIRRTEQNAGIIRLHEIPQDRFRR